MCWTADIQPRERTLRLNLRHLKVQPAEAIKYKYHRGSNSRIDYTK
jgi:hypothetical protein